jgi:MOSC domain-containing protein YiiM
VTDTEGMANVDSHDARVLQVNVGTVRELQWHGHTVRTAIWKQRVEGPVPLRGIGLHGDQQADRSVHGGADYSVPLASTRHHLDARIERRRAAAHRNPAARAQSESRHGRG